jgi:hypothetical protein
MWMGAMKLTSYTILSGILIVCKYWPDNGLFRPKLEASDWNNKIKRYLSHSQYTFHPFQYCTLNTSGCPLPRRFQVTVDVLQVALCSNTIVKFLHLSIGNKVTIEVVALLTFRWARSKLCLVLSKEIWPNVARTRHDTTRHDTTRPQLDTCDLLLKISLFAACRIKADPEFAISLREFGGSCPSCLRTVKYTPHDLLQ